MTISLATFFVTKSCVGVLMVVKTKPVLGLRFIFSKFILSLAGTGKIPGSPTGLLDTCWMDRGGCRCESFHQSSPFQGTP